MHSKSFDPTHYGMFLGVVPVALDMSDEACPQVEVRGSGIVKVALELWMDIVEGAFGMYCMARSYADPEFEPLFPIKITGEAQK